MVWVASLQSHASVSARSSNTPDYANTRPRLATRVDLKRHEDGGDMGMATSHRRGAMLGLGTLTLSLVDKPSFAKQGAGDWTSPGLATPDDDFEPRFFKTESGVKIQELSVGRGPEAKYGDVVELEYVCRRSNGYFIYSTVEGVSFQPRDVPTGPFQFRIGDNSVIPGLGDALIGMQAGGRRRALIPPELGYMPNTDLEPQPPTFAAKRQILNHSKEALLFEIQILKVRSRQA